jgi:Putative MetA-pathway of phenol degradation
MRKLETALSSVLFACAGLLASTHAQAQAQGDGPRAYQMLPENVRAFTAYGIFQDGNQTIDPATIIEGSDISIDIGIVQYVHPLNVRGQASGLFVAVPFGQVEGSFRTRPPFNNISGEASGVGDVVLGAIIGLKGSPSLSLQEYAKFKPGFAIGALAKLTLPTGSYDQDKILNLGANRVNLQLGAPMGWIFGESFLDPHLTTFELLPSVTFYGTNEDPFRADTLDQSPIFRLEGHLTRNLNKAIWISADALVSKGGETETDGIDDDNQQYSLKMGATVSFAVAKTASFKLSYGETVDSNKGGSDGKMFRIIGTVLF